MDTMYFLTYATQQYEAYATELCQSALSTAGFASAVKYGPADLTEAFRDRNAHILNQARGAGYWIWKPHIIFRHLQTVPDDSIVCYCDAEYLFCDDIQPYLRQWLAMNRIPIAIPEHKPGAPDTPGGPNTVCLERQWTKGDAFHLMGIGLDSEAAHTPQAWAGFFLLQKTFETLEFVAAWATYAQDHRIVDDTFRMVPNAEEFRENRHDQTVLSLLAKRWGVRFFKFPNGPLQNLRTPFAVPLGVIV